MKNLDVLEQEKQEQEAAKALLSVVLPAVDHQMPDIQPEENSGERRFTNEEVQQLVSMATARERVKMECREYLLAHYYGIDHVSAELDQVLQILDPKSVEDLAQKFEGIEALDSVEGTVPHTVSTSPRSFKASLKQVFGHN